MIDQRLEFLAMKLVFDIGNTRSKYAFFQEDRLIGVNYRLESILEDIRVWKEKGGKGLDISYL